MIARVGDVEVAARIEGNRPWVAHFAGGGAGAAEHFDETMLRVKDLDAAVTEFAHVLETLGVDTDVVGITEIAGCAAGAAERREEFAVGRKNLDAMIARVGDVDAVLRVDAETFGTIEFAGAVARFADGADKFVGRAERPRGTGYGIG